MTIPEIIDLHLNAWFADGVSTPGDGKRTLRERCADIVQDALDQHSGGLATELKDVESARDSWQQAYMDRADELRSMQASIDNLQDIVREVARIAQRDQNTETVSGSVQRLVDDLRRMTAARDDATAAHLITAERLQAVEIELGEAKKLLGL